MGCDIDDAPVGKVRLPEAGRIGITILEDQQDDALRAGGDTGGETCAGSTMHGIEAAACDFVQRAERQAVTGQMGTDFVHTERRDCMPSPAHPRYGRSAPGGH